MSCHLSVVLLLLPRPLSEMSQFTNFDGLFRLDGKVAVITGGVSLVSCYKRMVTDAI